MPYSSHLNMDDVPSPPMAYLLTRGGGGASVVATGYSIGNVDCTIIAQRPKMAPHIQSMRANIAEDLGLDISQVNVKAKTNEKLGYLGREEGIAAESIALLISS